MIFNKNDYPKLGQKRQKQFKVAYNKSTNYFLHDCYARNSELKNKAYLHCLATMNELKGKTGKIVSYNSMQFTYGFLVTDDITGILYLYVITKDNNYCFEY